MSFSTLHAYELTFIHHIQDVLREPFLDKFMCFMNLFDSMIFYYFLLAVVWFSYNEKCGIRLFLLFILNFYVIAQMKESFHQPRPFQIEPTTQIDPMLGLISVNFSSFPSGAAQGFVVLLGYLSYWIKKGWFTILSVLFILVVSFSRVYLGVHFPSDIIGGWVMGMSVLFLYIYLQPKAELALTQVSKYQKVGLVILTSSLLYFFSNSMTTVSVATLALGTGLGLLWHQYMPEAKNLHERFKRLLIQFSVVWLFLLASQSSMNHQMKELTGFSLSVFTNFLIGLWFSFGAPFFFRKKRF